MQNHRPYPHVAIPPGARPLLNPNTSTAEVYSPYAFELGSASDGLLNPWDATPTARRPTSRLDVPPRSRSRTRSALEAVPPTIAFPEPEIYRSASQRSTVHPHYHRSSRSDSGHVLGPEYESTDDGPSPYSPSVTLPADEVNMLTRELSNMSLQSEEGLRRFQNGGLAEKDEEWHYLVPSEAREALGKREVERQSVLFEVFKSERDYVSDLNLIREVVFAEPLASASPPIIGDANRHQSFLSTVFWNLDQICARHEQMLAALFERQRDQHPLVQSVADIILEAAFQFQADYESYIKHYPLAEQRHRTELKYNKRYQEFTQRCSQDPRVRKRDLITFLSRPVTRLPRLNLILEHLHKLTDSDHPDNEDLPVILSVLNDFLKSTQPGIAAAENQVKFWDLCESLVFNKGEIIELDRYNDNRSLIHAGTLVRRSKSEMDWNPWFELYVALLDNFLLITKEEKRGGFIKHLVVSRPIPLEYLRLGGFDDPPESRKERAEEGSILDSFRGSHRSVYPFTVYHAVEKSTRRYTLYAPSESARTRWRDALVDAKGVDDVRGEANQWFVPQVVDDGAFRVPGPRMVRSKKPPSGRVVQAVSFTASGGRSFMVVGCSSGIFVGRRGENYRKILSYENVKSIIVLQEFNKIIIHHDNYLLSYSLEVLARVAQYQSPPSSLDASLETIAGQDGGVLCCQAGQIGERTIIVYAIKTFFQVTVYAVEICHPSEIRAASPRTLQNGILSFRPFGEPLYVPKDAFSVMPMAKTIAICTDRGIVIANPTGAGKSVIAVVPDFGGASNSSNTAELKARCETAKPLGLIRRDATELMVVYDNMGCYITKHGQPARDSMFIRWEIKATSFVHRPPHVLLFSSEFIEIRDVQTGLLEQVIEGVDIRLLLYTPSLRGPLYVAMRGQKDDEEGASDRLVELVETAEITAATPASGGFTPSEGMWDEWDM
ncbi:hypothetical protein BS17DRAFT_705412 [Gyrodon lividus]|nr:hypothetical protein BS17DRAFT_705412 [Gyrodon lividus]